MIYLSWFYVAVLAVWAVSELIDQVKERLPKALLVAELIVQVLLILGVVLHITVGTVHPLWQAAAYPLIFGVFTLRGYGVKNEEHDVSDTREQRRRINLLNIAITFVVLAPALHHISALVSDGGRLPLLWASLGAIAGEVVGLALPRLSSRFESSNARRLAEWARTSPRFGRAPDRIELLDDRPRQWPGLDIEQSTQLFKVRFGDVCHVGGTVEPVCFCIPEPVPSNIEAQPAFEHCRLWFADKLSRALVRSAAAGMPEEFQQIVEEALSGKAQNAIQSSSAGDVGTHAAPRK